MLKKLLIPCFVFAAAVAVGCSSSNDNKTGTAGTSGGAAGTTGTAGSTAGTTGTAGSAAGTTGTAGSTAGTTGTAGTGGTGGGTAGTGGTGGGTAGTGGGTAGTGGTGGGTDAGTDATATVMACPAAAKAADYAGKIDAVVFCENFLANCTGISGFTIPTGYATESACEASWMANTTATGCRSYHLCGNAVGKDLPTRTTHCPHALGMNGFCTN